MKKYIIIVVVVLVLALGGYLLYARFKNAQTPVGTNVNVGPAAAPEEKIIPLDPQNIPAGDKIEFGTPHGLVGVNNFYKVARGFDGDALIVRQTSQYQIIYDAEASAFAIYIISGPVDRARAAAEKDLMGILGVSQAEACYLTISWAVSPSADLNLSGKARPLSFCPNNL